jgi:hypothetical protein
VAPLATDGDSWHEFWFWDFASDERNKENWKCSLLDPLRLGCSGKYSKFVLVTEIAFGVPQAELDG